MVVDALVARRLHEEVIYAASKLEFDATPRTTSSIVAIVLFIAWVAGFGFRRGSGTRWIAGRATTIRQWPLPHLTVVRVRRGRTSTLLDTAGWRADGVGISSAHRIRHARSKTNRLSGARPPASSWRPVSMKR